MVSAAGAGVVASDVSGLKWFSTGNGCESGSPWEVFGVDAGAASDVSGLNWFSTGNGCGSELPCEVEDEQFFFGRTNTPTSVGVD